MAASKFVAFVVLCRFVVVVRSSVSPELASEASVLFFDDALGSYLKSGSSSQGNAISPLAAAASTAALLGVGLPPEVDSSTAAQLADLLAPSAFKRPRAVFAAIVPGIDSGILADRGHALSRSGHVAVRALATPLGLPVRTPAEASLAAASLLHSLLALPASAGQDIQLAAVGCAADLSCGQECVSHELQALAEAVGWTYTGGQAGSAGLLSSHSHPDMVLDLSQAVVVRLVEELACLLRSARSHSRGQAGAPQLLYASITGLQAVQEEEGRGAAVSKAAAALVVDALSQAMLHLQEAHDGRLVGTVALVGGAQPVALGRLGASLESSRNMRRLQEDTVLSSSAAEALLLIKRVVLWGTGFVLLLAVLLGSCSLCCMQLTKDTLLYTSAKLE